jgi:hypothetical protein
MMQMPKSRSTYVINDPRGRELEVELDHDPTPEEVKAIFDRYDAQRPTMPDVLKEGVTVPSSFGGDVAFGGPMRSMLQSAYATPEERAQRMEAATQAAPGLAATAATMYPPVAAATGLMGVAARAGAAGVAGAATSAATGSDLWDAFKAGAEQAALQIGGEGLAKGVTALGQRMYTGFLKPSRSVRREFPKVAEQLYEQGRGINQKSLDAANDAIESLRQKVDDTILQGARQNVAPIDTSDLMMAYQEMMDYADRMIANKSQGPAIKQAIEKEFQYLARKIGKGVDVVDAQNRKRFFQSQADAAYEAVRRGQKSQLGWRDLMNMSVARELQNAIERRLPEVTATNRQIQQQIGQARALSDALGRIDNHMPFGSVSDVVSISSGLASGSALTGAAAKLASTAQTGQAIATQMGKLGRNVNFPLTLRLGQVVTVGDRKMRIVKVNPDGTYEGVAEP